MKFPVVSLLVLAATAVLHAVHDLADSEPDVGLSDSEAEPSTPPEPHIEKRPAKKQKIAVVIPDPALRLNKPCLCSSKRKFTSESCTKWFATQGLNKFKDCRAMLDSLHKLDQDTSVLGMPVVFVMLHL